MKKQYQTPNMQVTLLQPASIICTSQGGGQGPKASSVKSDVFNESVSSGTGSGRANSRGYDSGESDSWGLW